jgi:hypothetical protein
MATPTLTVGGITFTFNDGDCKKVDEDIQSEMENATVGGKGPMGSTNYDYTGVIKLITITGFLTEAASTRVSGGYTITSILAQKQWLESLVNGQQTAVTFTSTYSTQSVLGTTGASAPYKGSFTSTKAFVQKAKFTEVEGKPSVLEFSLTLQVGNA